MSQRLIEETGNRYGRLLVIRRDQNSSNGRTQWLCRCDCGVEVIVRGGDLRIGKTKSCGCLRDEKLIDRNKGRSLPKGQASFNFLYGKYRYAAKRRNLEFKLTKEDFSFLTKMNCFYCGIPPSKIIRPPSCPTTYTYNGIDRLDNSKGYTMDNVVPCCERCNKMKGTCTIGEFKKHILGIIEYKNWRKNNGN